jgi:hypothetical protein
MDSLTRAPAEVFTKPRDDLVTTLLGGWLMIGLLVDGWAHRNNAGVESFFTPWHAAFYSGFIAAAAWIVYLVRRPRSGFVMAGVPVGYRLGLIGIGVFGLGGLGDMLWHSFFGIEVSIDALVSPTHLVLLAGILLILTSPVRSSWHRPTARLAGWKLLLAPILAVGLVILLCQFFYMYASGFTTDALSEPYNSGDDFAVAIGMLELTITNLLIMGGGLLLIRRWRPPAGTFTLLAGLLAAGMQAVIGFERPLDIVAALAGGALMDAMVTWFEPDPANPRSLRLWGLAAPMGLWAAVIAGRSIFDVMAWPITLWLGAIVMMGLWGFGLAVLVTPAAAPGSVGSMSVGAGGAGPA